MVDVHYVPVSGQRYARILQILEQAPDPLDWNHTKVCALADDLYALATDRPGVGETPLPMAVDLLRKQAADLRGRDTINPPQLAARLASYVQRD